MGKRFIANCMHHWIVHEKVEFQKFSPVVRPGGSIAQLWTPELGNVRFTLISFMKLSAILNAVQPFQIYIFNRKYSKLTFCNGCQLMGKRFMAKFACIIRQYMQK